MKNDNSQEPNVQARQYQGKSMPGGHQKPAHLPPAEISMYVLLAAFCCAIVVFVVSCVVYAAKFKAEDAMTLTQGLGAAPVNAGNGLPVVHRENRKVRGETTTNVHDWVWLGRATLDTSNRNSTVTANNNAPNAANSNEMRITTNPLNMNYCDPEDCLATSFSNPSHIELPSRSSDVTSGRAIDSGTYCKNKVGFKSEVEVW